MRRICLALFFSITLGAQSPAGIIALQGQPTPAHPVVAETEGGNAVFVLGNKQVILESLKFKKPWLGSWQISFNLRNRTEHVLEGVVLQFQFANKALELLSSGDKALTIHVPSLSDSDAVTVPITLKVPSELRPEKPGDVEYVRPVLVAFRARMNSADVTAARELARRQEEERIAEARAAQERAEAEARAQREREARERSEAEAAAAKAKIQKAVEASKKKQQEIVAQKQGAANAQPNPAQTALNIQRSQPTPEPTPAPFPAFVFLIVLGLVTWAVRKAYGRSTASEARKCAQKALAALHGLETGIRDLQRRISETQMLAAGSYVAEIQAARLRAIPIEELKRLAPGARIQALRDNGIRDLASLQGRSATSLTQIRGIGPDSASKIANAVGSLVSSTSRQPIPIPWPGSERGKERPLLEAIHNHIRVKDWFADPDNRLSFHIAAFRDRARQIETATTFRRWLFSFGKPKGIAEALAAAHSMEGQLAGNEEVGQLYRTFTKCYSEANTAIRTGVEWTALRKDIELKGELYQQHLANLIGARAACGPPSPAPPQPMASPVQKQQSTPGSPLTLSISFQSHAQVPVHSTLPWVPPGKEITFCGFRIPDGMLYLIDPARPQTGGEREPSLLNPKLPVQHSGADPRVRTMGYWPSYDSISPEARGAYLLWLSSGRAEPSADIGYVFLYFYGLERRVLIDAPYDPVARAEVPAIENEILRLLGIYNGNGSFLGYATSLLDYLRASRGELEWSTYAIGPRHYGLTLGQKIALGKIAEAGEPIPAKMACGWFLADPTTRRRTSFERCPEIFRSAFKNEFTRLFPEGLKLPQNKTRLKVAHRAASAALAREIYSVDLPLPDVSVLSSSIQKIQKVGDAVGDALEPFSRCLGRNPGQEKTLEALLLLPIHLWPEPALEPLNCLSREIGAADRPQVMPYVNLQSLLPEGNDFNRARYGALCRALEGFGLGIEPDVRFGGAVPDLKDLIALFRLPEEGRDKDPGPSFNAAALLVHLASAVAGADGDFGEAEARLLLDHIHHGLALPGHEALRLQARLELFRRVPPSITGLKRKIESLKVKTRIAIGDFLVHVVHADGIVNPGEVRILERVYKLLGLETGELYSQLHGAVAEPITVRPASETSPSYRIPTPKPDPVPGTGLKLDMAKVAALKEDSAKVAALLGSIFSETTAAEPIPDLASDPEPPTESGTEESLLGLDPEHHGLLRALLGRPRWTRAELEEMCADRGLMVDGAIERINEAVFDRFDQPLIEGDDPLDINTDLTLEEAV